MSLLLLHTIIAVCACFLMPINALYNRSTPGGGGAMNSPIYCGGRWIVGTDLGGLYVQSATDNKWTAIGYNNGGLTSTHIASLACWDDDTTKVLVGSHGGLFVGSLDESLEMTELLQIDRIYVSAVAAAERSPVAYAGGQTRWNGLERVVWRTDDTGNNFQSVAATGLPTELRIIGMRPHPVDRNGLWIISGKGRGNESPPVAHYTSDGGNSFLDMGISDKPVLDMQYSYNPDNLNEMYMTTLDNDNVGRLYRAERPFGQDPWLQLALELDLTGIILPDKTNHLHLRLLDGRPRTYNGNWGSATWETFDGGETWTQNIHSISGVWPPLTPAVEHRLFHSFQGKTQTSGYRPDRPTNVLWTTSQFAFESTDGGISWNNVVSESFPGDKFQSNGLDNVVPMVVSALTDVVYAGYADLGLFRSDDGGETWKNINAVEYTSNWNGRGGNTLSVLADPDRTNVVWTQMAGTIKGENKPVFLLKSTDKGTSWINLSNNGLPSNPRLYESIELDPTSPINSRILYVVVDGDVYKSSDDGTIWTITLACGSCVRVRYTESFMFAFGPSGIWRSSSGNFGSWETVDFPVEVVSQWDAAYHWYFNIYDYRGPMDLVGRGVSEVWLAVLKGNRGSVGGLYYSSNSGETWSLVYENAWVRSVDIDPVSERIILGSSTALTSGGFRTTSSGVVAHANGTTSSEWVTENDNLAWPFCTSVRFGTDGRRWVISPGEGVLVSPSSTTGQYCFSGENLVVVFGKGEIAMRDLSVGDLVQSSQGKFSRLYSMFHLDHVTGADYLQIFTDNQPPLEISSEHYLFANGQAVVAGDIQVGDVLIGKNGEEQVVSAVKSAKRIGLYAPGTESGVIVVSGILASNYIHISDSTPVHENMYSHAVLSPIRLLCRILPKFCAAEKHTHGISNLVVPLVSMAETVDKTSSLIRFIILLLGSVVLSVFMFVEQVASSPATALAVIAGAYFVEKQVLAKRRFYFQAQHQRSARISPGHS